MKIIHVNRINVSISGNNHTSKNYTDTDIYIYFRIFAEETFKIQSQCFHGGDREARRWKHQARRRCLTSLENRFESSSWLDHYSSPPTF